MLARKATNYDLVSRRISVKTVLGFLGQGGHGEKPLAAGVASRCYDA
jgi:hypothetical protein